MSFNFIFSFKECNQYDFSIDHLVTSLCWVVSCVVGRACLLWLVHSLSKGLLDFALLHFVLQGQNFLLLQVSLDFLLLYSSALWLKGHLFGVSSRMSYRSSENHSTSASISGWNMDLDYCDTECFALEKNRNHFVIFFFFFRKKCFCILKLSKYENIKSDKFNRF